MSATSSASMSSTALLAPPSALERALANVIAGKQREWEREKAVLVAESRAIVAELRERVAALEVRLKDATDAQIARVDARLAEVRDGRDGAPGERGEKGDPGDRGESGERGPEGARGEKGDAGERGEKGDIGPAGLPGERGEKGDDGADGERGEDGAPGRDGKDGADAPPPTEEQLAAIVARHVQANPPPAGKDGAPGERGPAGDRGEKGADGRDGRDGLPGVPGAAGEKGRDGIDGKHGTNGADGFSLDDLAIDYDGFRTITLRFERGDLKRERAIKLPIPADAGVFREGNTYDRGDSVSFGGNLWIAQADGVTEKPGTGAEWRLAVKKGRDGKDTVTTRPIGPVKTP